MSLRFLRPWAVIVSIVVALIAASGIAGASIGLIDLPFGLGSDGLRADRFHPVGATIKHGGVSITLDEVGYSSSETILKLHASDFPEDHNLRRFIADQGRFRYTGFAERRPEVVNRITGPDELSLSIVLGPADPGTALTFEIGRVYIESNSGEGTFIDGPWSFSFSVPATAVDPIDLDVHVAIENVASGQQVYVDRLRLSSSGLEVHYQLEVDDGFIGPAGWYARVILPDGTWRGGAPVLDDPARTTGELRVDFRPLPPSTADLTLSFGPFLDRIEGPFSFDMPLPDIPDSRPSMIPMGYVLNVLGESIEVTEIRLEEDRFSILLSNTNQGDRTIVHDTTAEADLFDDLGNEYTTEQAFWEYGEDEVGASTGGSLLLTFRGTLPQSADALRLEVPSVARLEYGPDFDLTLPALNDPQP